MILIFEDSAFYDTFSEITKDIEPKRRNDVVDKNGMTAQAHTTASKVFVVFMAVFHIKDFAQRMNIR